MQSVINTHLFHCSDWVFNWQQGPALFIFLSAALLHLCASCPEWNFASNWKNGVGFLFSPNESAQTKCILPHMPCSHIQSYGHKAAICAQREQTFIQQTSEVLKLGTKNTDPVKTKVMLSVMSHALISWLCMLLWRHLDAFTSTQSDCCVDWN